MRVGRAHAPMARCGRDTPARASSSSMTSCSRGDEPRPHGTGQCGMIKPASASAWRRSGPSGVAATPSTSLRTSARSDSASGGSSAVSSRRAPPTASAVTSCSSAPASPPAIICRLDTARLRYRCASCSQVNPIPPRVWTHCLAQRAEAGSATQPAMHAVSRAPSAASAPSSSLHAADASQATAAHCSTATSMSASACLTA